MKLDKYVALIILVALTVFSSCSKNDSSVSEVSAIKVDSISTIPLKGTFIHPVFNPADNQLFFTDLEFKGIYKYDLKTQSFDTVVVSDGAGYNYAVFDNNIFYAKYEFNHHDKMASYSLLNFNLDNKTEEVVYKSERKIHGIKYQSNSQVSFFIMDTLKVFNIAEGNFASSDKLVGQTYLINMGKIRTYAASGMIEYTLSDSNNISAVEDMGDGSLMINVSSEGLFVYSPADKSLKKLGNMIFPRWNPVNKIFSYTVQKNDGHKIENSSIRLRNLDGTIDVGLRDGEMNLDENVMWSHDGRRIAFNDFDGKLYIANISYK